jgi:RNA polymerase sigma factor (sigma-70 family)
MRTPQEGEPGTEAVIAAQRGDAAAIDRLASAYLPLVYNIVGRAMNGHPDVDDVVQETMLRAVRGIKDLRDPESFRSWLVAIAMRQVRDSYRERLAQAPAAQSEVPSPDFADLSVTRLGLSGQRRETAQATRWLDDEDRPVLALWWQEAAGELSRAELAEALGLPPAHAAVRVARMKERLATSRMVVRALHRVPPCERLAAVTSGWDRQPSSLWRKRLARHVRECAWCTSDAQEMVPAERLLSGLPLLPVPAALAFRALTRLLQHPAPRPPVPRAVWHARHARLLTKTAALQPKIIAASLAVACVTGGTYAVVHSHHAPAPAALSVKVTPPASPVPPSPLVTLPARLKRPPAKRKPKPTPPPSPAVLTSARKGVAAWNFTGVTQALGESGASWYYDWAASPNGITSPPGVSFVPMIWGAKSVTTATLDQAEAEGHVLLGFNEPDLSSQSDMTVQQALDLWPKLMATGMTLGSPAVAYDAATPGGWLDQFMRGAAARGYRINFITVHWYGGDFSTGPAVQQLQSYLQAIYDRYHLPIWLTEFALANYGSAVPSFPAEDQQAAFLTAATRMLAGLSYVQRYAWFALPTSAGSGTTGLFNPGPVATEVGRAFEAAPLSGQLPALLRRRVRRYLPDVTGRVGEASRADSPWPVHRPVQQRHAATGQFRAYRVDVLDTDRELHARARLGTGDRGRGDQLVRRGDL